ncbi:MAG: hypothetical protein AAB448_02185 [Patescibacteria group bacterium]
MALTKKDLQEFGKELTRELKKELISKEDLVLVLAQTRTDIVRDIRDEMDARFSSFRNEMKGDRENLRKEIQTDFMEVIHDNLLPAIDAVHHRVDDLGGRVDGLSGRVDNLGGRVDNLCHRIDGLETKIGSLEKKVDYVHHDLKQELIAVRRFIHMPAT